MQINVDLKIFVLIVLFLLTRANRNIYNDNVVYNNT